MNTKMADCPLNALGLDKVYLINLNRRPDRLEAAMEQVSTVGLEGVERFEATDGTVNGFPVGENFLTPGMVGCYHSHRRILEDAYQQGYEKILVLEDDLQFVPGFNDLFNIVWEKRPPCIDWVWLGWFSRESEGRELVDKRHNEFWFVPEHIWGTQAYLILTRKGIEGARKALLKPKYQVDVQYCLELPKVSIDYWCPDPSLVAQAGFSTDIQQQKLSMAL